LAGALGGPDGITSLAVFPSSTWKTAFHFKVREIEIEESLRQLRAVHRVPQFAGMFLGLGLILRSYHVRELLACWLFFSLVFGPLALIVFASVLTFAQENALSIGQEQQRS
jgi:hypothetical protein